ncbi:hypothetical protein CERZMDRAFT_54456, partial [Cercospora zeae-maydis SCOH1-5]
MDSASGIGKRRAAPVLCKENWRQWFSLLQDHLESKDVFWIISETLPESSVESSPSVLGLRHSRSNPEWVKANATARYEMTICLSEDDQEETIEERQASKIWEKMRAKYSKVYTAHAMAYVQEFVNFQMTEDMTIRKAWVQLASMARRIAEVDPQEAHYKEPERRLKHLLNSLPEAYQSTKDTILAQQSMSYESALQLLESHEARLNQSQETAMFAKGKGIQGTKLKCYLCDQEHFGGVAKCPHLDKAKRTVNPRQSHRVEKRRTPPRESSFRRRSSPDKEALKDMDDDVDEVAHSTVEAKGKYMPSRWLLDSCASSHMTDQESLFRELKPLQRKKWIKVGGGYLIATHVGNAVMGGKRGKQIVLKNVLFVPGLGVNLVS